MRRLSWILIAVATLAVAVLAQAKQAEGGPIYQRRVVVNFDDEVIESGTEAPLLELQTVRRPTPHPCTIRLRQHFRREVLLSGRDL